MQDVDAGTQSTVGRITGADEQRATETKVPHMTEPELPMRSLDQALPMVLMRAREAAMSMFRPMLAEHGLTEPQWRVLRTLADRAPIEAGALADATFLLAPSLSRILTGLADRSLIVRETPDEDRRRSIISLSVDGRELVAEIAPFAEAIYDRLESRFGAGRLGVLITELEALTAIEPWIDEPQSRRSRTPPPATEHDPGSHP